MASFSENWQNGARLAQQNNSAASVGSVGFSNQTSGGLVWNPSSLDSQINAVNQQALWDREDFLRRLAEYREDYSMDRLVAAAKRNGINPIFLLDALSSNPVGNAASYTTSAAKANNYDTNDKTDQATSAKIIGSLIAAIAMIAVAML